MKTINAEDKTVRQDNCEKPQVSVVVPAYNEEGILEQSLSELCHYMKSLEGEYHWELIVIDDGSTDRTGELAEAFAENRDNVHVLHHTQNFRLGQALRTAFKHCQGDYMVPLDVDLSYSPEHIEKLLITIRETKAKVVIASPYMKGGQVSNVPWIRRQFSIWANRFLSLTVTKDRLTGKLSTLTGMVRAYDRRFLSKLDLKAMDVDINSEILYKTMVLRGLIVEIPAHLNWKPPRVGNAQRKSNIRVLRSIMASLLSGFMFRPFMFFILSGFGLLLVSCYTLGRAFFHIVINFQALPASSSLSQAIAMAMTKSPLSFLVGGFTLLLGIQFISLGFLALQAKKYFEELFHLGSSIYGDMRENLERERHLIDSL